MLEPAGMPDTVPLLVPAFTAAPLSPDCRVQALVLLSLARSVLPVVTKLMLPAKLLKRVTVVPARAARGRRPRSSRATGNRPARKAGRRGAGRCGVTGCMVFSGL